MESCVHNGMDIKVVQNDNPTELSPNTLPQFQGFNGGFHLGGDDFHNFFNFSVSGPDFGDCLPMESPTGRKSFNKRKAEAILDDKCKDKRVKGETDMESESKTKCSTGVSRNSSMENSKASEAQQKPDYIHVRARRGQATDSHSLAERARREKISKKMKCLQDLVPGCNKITGKAGMLDEIINYVQSLQKQVEFLSMKLAALNPTVGFNVENLQMKEFAASVANFPAAVNSTARASLAFLQLNPLQKEAVNCMLDATTNPPQTVTEGFNTSSSLSIPEQALGSSCITCKLGFPFPKMATESSESEEEGKITGGNQHLVVEDDLREMGKKAAWSVSSCKTGNGVSSLRDDNLETYWQSDGAQPHLVNIQFQKKVKLQLVVLYVDFKLDESYTPSKISIRAGDGFHNLKEIKTVELVKPTGWVYLSLSGNDPRETFVNTFMLQIAVLSNHLNGRDTHVRQIKVYGPRPNPIPHQPFQFTSREFITYSTVRHYFSSAADCIVVRLASFLVRMGIGRDDNKAMTTDAIVSRCQKAKNLLEQGLCQVQSMVPVMLAVEISQVVDDLQAANFVPDKFDAGAGKAVRELLQQGTATPDSVEYTETRALQTAASQFHITSSAAILIEKRSIKRLLEKVLDTDVQKISLVSVEQVRSSDNRRANRHCLAKAVANLRLLHPTDRHDEDLEHALTILLTLCSQRVEYCQLVIDECDIFPALFDVSVNGSDKGKTSALELLRLLI
ncbi:hypothetical protein GQ457_05G012840 [Hibiscus cannabinus]